MIFVIRDVFSYDIWRTIGAGISCEWRRDGRQYFRLGAVKKDVTTQRTYSDIYIYIYVYASFITL